MKVYLSSDVMLYEYNVLEICGSMEGSVLNILHTIPLHYLTYTSYATPRNNTTTNTYNTGYYQYHSKVYSHSR